MLHRGLHFQARQNPLDNILSPHWDNDIWKALR